MLARRSFVAMHHMQVMRGMAWVGPGAGAGGLPGARTCAGLARGWRRRRLPDLHRHGHHAPPARGAVAAQVLAPVRHVRLEHVCVKRGRGEGVIVKNMQVS